MTGVDAPVAPAVRPATAPTTAGTTTCVDAVVVAYRSASDLPACLASLRSRPEVGRIVVVDHGDDDSASVARDHGADVVVSDPTNPGFGAGQNRGVASTSAPYVLLCNPDARLHPGALSAGIAVLDADPGLAAVQGVVSRAGGRGVDRSAGRELGPAHLYGRALGLGALLGRPLVGRLLGGTALADTAHRIPDRPTEVESLAATAVLVRRRAFEAVGGFDTRHFLYGEDLDLCRRLRDRGWRLRTLPVAWAEHAEGSSSSSTRERETAWWGGTLTFAARWWSPPRWWAALGAAGIAAARLAAGDPRRLIAHWRAMTAGARRRRRNR